MRGKNAGYYGTPDQAKEFYRDQSAVPAPTLAGKYAGSAALTEDQLNATSFKNGGKFTYSDYLK
jgi:hypothetical protein